MSCTRNYVLDTGAYFSNSIMHRPNGRYMTALSARLTESISSHPVFAEVNKTCKMLFLRKY